MVDVNERMFLVLQGFSKLDYEERNIILKAIREYHENIDAKKRIELMESIARSAGVTLGPTGGGRCPCCGR